MFLHKRCIRITLIYIKRIISDLRFRDYKDCINYKYCIAIVIIFISCLFIRFYLMEPVQCSSPNAWAQAFDPASYERSQYRLLKTRLEMDMNNELDIRGRNGVKSSVVTLIDLGIKWK